tara:strand:- start:288 stop:551 length:264 start_codon:yes stop_codon:yes gene_type:complete
MSNKWGDSTVSTSYMFSKIHDILDCEDEDEMCQQLSNLHHGLAKLFFRDTGLKIGPFVHGPNGKKLLPDAWDELLPPLDTTRGDDDS